MTSFLSRLYRPVLFSLFLGACATTAPDPRAELRRAINDPQADGYLFTTVEDDGQVRTSLTNPDVRNTIRLPEGDRSLTLGYTSIRDRRANTTKIYRLEVARSAGALALVARDVRSGAVFETLAFPALPARGPDFPLFPSFEDCICKGVAQAQCDADRTCKTQIVGLICCTSPTQCISVHIIVTPKAWRCRFADLFGDLGDLVFTQ